MDYCGYCGIELQQDRKSREQKKYCSNRCQSLREQYILTMDWLETGECNPGTNPNHYVRRYILQDQHFKCAICQRLNEWEGKELVLTLDHIDGNHKRNNRENLRLICANCDSQLPTYKGRNVGKGRKSRRKEAAVA